MSWSYLPVAEWVVGPIVDCEVQVVGCDGSHDIRTTLVDCFYGIACCAVLEDDLELFSDQVSNGSCLK